tara:strand:- start:9698 stop:11077 length:1380 start_codon:yes stop_codon:yes gene_type:complete
MYPTLVEDFTFTARECSFDIDGSSGSRALRFDSTATGFTHTITLENCVIRGGTAGSIGTWVRVSTGTSNVTCIGVTWDDARIELRSVDTLLVQGSLLNVPTIGKSGTTTATMIDCILSAASPGWDTETNCTYSTTFNDSGTPNAGEVSWTNATADDYSLVYHADNLAIGYCDTATMPATDIIGTTRNAPEDAGAYEATTTTGSTISLDSVDSQYVSLTEGVDNSNDYTVCWWMTSPAGLSNYASVATFKSGDDQFHDLLGIQKGNSESQWRANIGSRSQHPTVTTYTGFVIGAGPWFVTYKRDGDDVTCRVYHGATYTEGTVTRVTTGRSSVTETSLGAYHSSTTTTATAEFAHFKAWSRALTDSELAREKEFSRAQIRDSIVGEWAMRGGSVLRDLDYSGRGNALVETGKLTDGFTSFGVAVAPQPLIIVEEASAPAPAPDPPAPVTVTLLTTPVNLY